ncbi:MAG: sulfatase [Myxococcales bacterium]|nr:sulfatase [Myxococcales bacterium]
MRISLTAAAAGLCLALACGDPGSAGQTPEAARGVRIVLITLDTLRRDSFSAASGSGSSMPRTRAFASRGWIFENYYTATPNTQPSHASLLTGLHPWEHGVVKNGVLLDDAHATLAELLRERGFATAAVVASFPLHAKFGFDQGFDVFLDDFTRDLGVEVWGGAELENAKFYSLADRVTQRALDLLQATESGRQFFWFHYFDPHEPYGDTGSPVIHVPALLKLIGTRSPAIPAALERARRAYERDNAFLDRALDRLFAALQRDAARFETHVVLASDHGESFGEGGVLGHGHHVREEQIRVPMFIVSPQIGAGARADAAGSVDIPNTIFALAGIDNRLGRGRDLTRPLVAGGAAVFGMSRPVSEPYDYVGTDGATVTIRSTRFYSARGPKMVTGDSEQLDPEPADAEIAGRIRSDFERFARALDASVGRELVDAETRRALEALGYAEPRGAPPEH